MAYDKAGKVARGRLAATSEETATELLSYGGYQVISLKMVPQAINLGKLLARFSKVKTSEIILFYRQLALLLNSGIDIISSLELLQEQTSSRTLTMALGEVISDLRNGNRLSTALGKHPQIFASTYCRLLNIGEETGSFETMLRHIADYMEKEQTAAKGIKNALIYPVMAVIVTVIVVGVLITFVLPAFGNLYKSLGVELPTMTRILMDMGNILKKNGIYLVAAVMIIAMLCYSYLRTPAGRLKRDRLILRLPVLGRVTQLKELARVCRSISLLFHAGLPLTEIIHLTSEASGNKVISNALADVQQDMIKGDGLSGPMAKKPCFLPMMVHMVRVGEETGNLDTNLLAVAENYDTEAQDKTKTLIGLIQPTMTLIIGLIVGLIALSLTSAMYSIYGKGGF